MVFEYRDEMSVALRLQSGDGDKSVSEFNRMKKHDLLEVILKLLLMLMVTGHRSL